MGAADRDDEADYDTTRAGEWADHLTRSTGVSRRRVLQMLAAVPPLWAASGWRPAAAQTKPGPAPTIVKPLPPEWFTVLGTNAEMRWDALSPQGFAVANERFFVRNHTSTPTIDARAWRLHPAGRRTVLHGRSWSGAAPIRRVDVSLDGGTTWRPADLRHQDLGRTWTRWTLPWTPRHGDTGPHQLLARATDRTGATQPATVPFNDGGYQFWATVHHPVTIA